MKVLEHLPADTRSLLYEAGYTVPRALRGLLVHHRSDVPFLTIDDLTRLRSKSDTLFILGSGSSLGNIRPEHWEIVSESVSFGFNFSLIHPSHVPDLHAVETASERSEVGRRLLQVVRERLSPQTILLHSDSAPPSVAKILTGNPAVLRFQEHLYRHFPEQFRMAIGCAPLSRNAEELQVVLKRWHEWGYFDGTSLPFVFKYRGTLSMMVSLGIIAKFRRIVICGVDLNHSMYFYQDSERYPEWRDFRSSKAGKQHATQKDYPSVCNMKEVVASLNKVAEQAGIRIYIESPESALNEVLPLFEWSSQETKD